MRPALMPICAIVLLLAGCGGGGDDDETPTPSGPAVSDKEYVTTICTGINAYTDAILSKGEDEIRESVRAFVDEMSATAAPADARDFHAEFVDYLEQGLDDPTILLTAPPPQPADDVKERLARVETEEGGCKYPFFSRVQATATPGG